MVLGYLEGERLAQELENQRIFNEGKIRTLLADLLPVLDFIHGYQVIRRDTRPGRLQTEAYGTSTSPSWGLKSLQ